MKNKKLKKKLLHYKQLFKYNTKTIKAQFDTVLVQMRRVADLKKQNADLQEAYDNAEQTIQELQSINAITKEHERVETEESKADLHRETLNTMNAFSILGLKFQNEDESPVYDILFDTLFYARYNKRPDVQTKRES